MANVEDFHISFDNLLKMGYAVIDVRYKDYEITSEAFKYIITRVDTDRDQFYMNMIKLYTSLEVKQAEVFELWIEILKHKIEMSKVLNRDIAIRVASLDYVETKYKKA